MTIDGIWADEALGAFGWENRGIVVLEKGRIIGGSDRDFYLGTYSVSGNNFDGEVVVHYYRPPRVEFGEAKETFALKLTGTLDNDVIDGLATRPDKPGFDVQYRLTKRSALP